MRLRRTILAILIGVASLFGTAPSGLAAILPGTASALAPDVLKTASANSANPTLTTSDQAVFSPKPHIGAIGQDLVETPQASPSLAAQPQLVALLKWQYDASGYTVAPGSVAGSGPKSGYLEVSSRMKSSRAVQNFAGKKPVDFIYDPQSKRFVMGNNTFGHDGVLDAAGIGNRSGVVGGRISRTNGMLVTDEFSGHYGMNWTPEVRQEFTNFMQSQGVSVKHTPWGQ